MLAAHIFLSASHMFPIMLIRLRLHEVISLIGTQLARNNLTTDILIMSTSFVCSIINYHVELPSFMPSECYLRTYALFDIGER